MMLIPVLCLLSLAMAEPPVGDGYPSARSHDHNDHEHGVDFQRSGGFPSPFGASRSHGFGSPKSGGKTHDHDSLAFRNGPSQEYGVPGLRNSPQESHDFGHANTRSAPQGHGSFAERSSPSTQYGAPEFRSAPSQEYGSPSQRSFGGSQRHNSVSSRNSAQKQNAPSFRGSGLNSASPSQEYGAPSARNQFTGGYEAPNARGLSQEYGVPSGRDAHSKTDAFASPFGSARSSPSNQYLPSSRDAPSEQYGAPNPFSGLSRQALEELLNNQEPASYDFGYKVSDGETGSDFGHTETRQENRAEGSYFVVLPDGTKQVVEYEADERGFKPRISVEPAEGAGYDDNAASLARNAQGPY